jgi:hypothetical protein
VDWDVFVADEVLEWIQGLAAADRDRVAQAIDVLADLGPGLGRPLVDTIKGSSVQNLKELRVGSVRILFAFDPWRACILLVAGDKANRWQVWYREAIPVAERRFQAYLADREVERAEERKEGEGR